MMSKPYVYKGEHSITKEIYFGYREKNKESGLVDLFKYKTSSKKVRPIFDEFNWEIVAEFENGNDAYDVEQKLIYENWGNPLLLNKNCHYNQKRFKSDKGRIHSTETRDKIGKAHIGKKRKPFTKETLERMSVAQKGKPKSEEQKLKQSLAMQGRKQSPETIAKRVAKTTGKTRTQETCDKIGAIHKGKIVTNETKNLQSQKAKERASIKFKCPYCLKEMGNPNFDRWHGNNCKHKQNTI